MEKNYMDDYKLIIKKKQILGMLSLILLLFYAISLIVFFINLDNIKNSDIFILLIQLPLLIIVILMSYSTIINKCPKCKKYMGRGIFIFCPICGEKIRNK